MDTLTQTLFSRKERERVSSYKKIEDVARESSRVLFKADAVFPFDLWGSKIIIEENKVNLVYGLFIMSIKVVSAPIANINNVRAISNLLFGSIMIEIIGYNQTPETMPYLWEWDALKARRIINGLIICHKERVDLSKLDIKYVRRKVEEIGRSNS